VVEASGVAEVEEGLAGVLREWDDKDPKVPAMHPADLARYLGMYAERVMTLRGTASTTGLDLMTRCGRRPVWRRTKPTVCSSRRFNAVVPR
jgi:hypothetical protein